VNVKWKIRPAAGGGFDGVIEIPVHPGMVAGGGKITALAKGADKATALAKAAVVADQIMANPVVAALMPPQAAVAVKAIKALSKSAAVGKLADVAGKFKGPAMDRLKKILPW
jgi:hypothetical protein